jgi:DNA-binding transcriptional MerR regulator
MYSEDDIDRLERIILFRNAGLPLSAIDEILDKTSSEVESALECRLITINKEIQTLRSQQKVILNIINSKGAIVRTRLVTKERWVAMLRAAGLDEEGMKNWHIAFEKSSPEAHQDFLESIGIQSDEIASIREWSQSSI